MRIIDRYITKTVIWSFLATILIFALLYILIDSASNLDEFIDRSVAMDIIIQYYLSYLPVIIDQTMSIAFLIAALLTYANLSTHNELIALRSSGLGFWRLARPALILALIISAGSFYINEKYIPLAEQRAQALEEQHLTLEVDRRKRKDIIKNLTFYGLNNRLYFIDSFDTEKEELYGITIIGFDEDQTIQEKIVAPQGIWTGIAWKFLQTRITTFPGTPDAPTRVKIYEEKLMNIKETPKDFRKQRLNIRYMNLRQLREYITRFAKSDAHRAVNNLKVDFHEKIAFPFTPFIIIMVGLPLVMITGRRRAQTFSALGVGILIGFLYYVLNAVGLALGKGGVLPPMASAWLAPGTFTLAAAYIIKTRF
ncbi:MAG: LptF/LptG family permease [Candidatus Omnitrophota bacterium]